MTKKEVYKFLNELTSSKKFYQILCLIAKRDFCYVAGLKQNLKSMDSYLNESEFAFLTGLWVKNAKTEVEYTKSEAANQVAIVTKLMADLHRAILPKFDMENITIKDFYENGERIQESIFYSDSGAYDHQLRNLIVEKYKYDNDWFKRYGLEINYLPKFVNHIKKIIHEKLNAISQSRKRSLNHLEIFVFDKREITNNDVFFERILNALSIEIGPPANAQLNDIGDYNIITSKPIVKISQSRYFVTSTFSIAQALYESPFYWMLEDVNYKTTALENRGAVAEELVVNTLKMKFDDRFIDKNVLIKKNKEITITDIDVLLTYGGKSIIFQVKSKRLTQVSKQGDINSIKKDLHNAFGFAYKKQGLEARKVLMGKGRLGKIEGIDHSKIDDVKECIVVVVTLDFYPALMSQIYSLVEKDDECQPIGISIFDLQIIVELLKSREQIIDYFFCRSKLSHQYLAENEMCLLSFYIQQGMKPLEQSESYYIDNSFAKDIDFRVNNRHYHDESYAPKAQHTRKKIGRNNPCYCLSGLKYKNCHGRV